MGVMGRKNLGRTRNFHAQHDHLMLEFQQTSANCDLFNVHLPVDIKHVWKRG